MLVERPVLVVLINVKMLKINTGIDVCSSVLSVFLFLSNMNVHRDHACAKESHRIAPPCPKPGFVVPNIQLRIQLIKDLRLSRLKAAKFSSSHIPKRVFPPKKNVRPTSKFTSENRRCSTTGRWCSTMNKRFAPKPSCNPKLMEVAVEIEAEAKMKGDDELKEPVKKKTRVYPPSPLDKYKGKPWFREIVKLDMECRLIRLQLYRARTEGYVSHYLEPHKDKPWYAKVVQADRSRLFKEFFMYRKQLAILKAKPSDAEEAEP